MIDLLSGIIALLLDASKNLAAKTIQGDQLQEGAEYTLNEKTNDISVLEDSLSNCVDAIGSTHQGDDTASKTFALAMIKIWADTSVNSRISKLCGKLYYHFLKLGVPYQREHPDMISQLHPKIAIYLGLCALKIMKICISYSCAAKVVVERAITCFASFSRSDLH